MNKDISLTPAPITDPITNQTAAHDEISCGYTHHHHDHSMSHHSHDNSVHDTHTHSIARRIAEAEQACLVRSVRWTPLRSDVLTLILQATKPVGAYDLLAKMTHQGRPPAPPTVYRTLDFLLEQGFIHRLTSINAFVPCCHPRHGHQAAFLICQRCHRVDEAESANLQQSLLLLAEQGGFLPLQTTIEVAGLCVSCQQESMLEQQITRSSDTQRLAPKKSLDKKSKKIQDNHE